MNEGLKVMESGGEEANGGRETGWEEVERVEFLETKETSGERAEMAGEAHADDVSGEDTRERAKAEHLAVLREQMTGPKPVEELSDEDATKEYLDLLLDLSAGFTSAEGRLSRAAAKDKDGNTVIMGRGYSGDYTFAEGLMKQAGIEVDRTTSGSFQEGDFHYNNEYLDRAHTLTMVDGILKSEEAWRGAGDVYKEASEEVADAEAALEKFREEDGKKGVLKKMFTFGKRRKERKQLEANLEKAQAARHGAEMFSARADRDLQQGLNLAYSEDYGYGEHRLNYEHEHDEEYKDRTNRGYNAAFFGENDLERQTKIERALELRRRVMEQKK